LRITSTPPGAAVDLDQVDLSSLSLYTDGDAHQVWHALRAQRPVFWNGRPAGRGFWAVTRHVDVRRVLRDHELFTSERGTAVEMVGLPDLAAGKMMHATDPPCHQQFREPIQRPLSAQAVTGYLPMVRSLVDEMLAPVPESTHWDAAQELARLPVAVMVHLMNLPEADIGFLLRAAYASVAPDDPRYRAGSATETLKWSHSVIVDYFTRCVRDRRGALASDLLSHLISMEVGGRPLSDEEVVLNCFSLLIGGVVTTAQAVTATLIALAERGRGEGRWPAGARTAAMVDEALRWSSPTTHFMRYARRDTVLHGVTIRRGDPVTAWIASANRDEEVFDRPYVFDPGRQPNRHIAFGTGPHRCVGRQLARVVLQETFKQLMATVDTFELADPPTHLRSNLIAGVVRLPLRLGTAAARRYRSTATHRISAV
jgi:cytochrome P450